MFDFPDTKKGIDAYDKQWDFFYVNPRGPISFVPSAIEVTASDEVAFDVHGSLRRHFCRHPRFPIDHRAAQDQWGMAHCS